MCNICCIYCESLQLEEFCSDANHSLFIIIITVIFLC
jgi:hypothetical protein